MIPGSMGMTIEISGRATAWLPLLEHVGDVLIKALKAGFLARKEFFLTAFLESIKRSEFEESVGSLEYRGGGLGKEAGDNPPFPNVCGCQSGSLASESVESVPYFGGGPWEEAVDFRWWISP